MRNSECRMQSSTAVGLFLMLASLSLADENEAAFSTETIRGRVVYLAEAMEKQAGLPSVPEARERVLALQTGEGEFIPLLEDVRGRAFRRDERLRAMQLELVVRRYKNSPFVQIIRVIEVTKNGRFEIDYWCDVCAIAMFEKKDCDCCQGDVELRRRPL